MQKIGIIGTGTMATGIAQNAAQSGYDVVLRGRSQESTTQSVEGIAKAHGASVTLTYDEGYPVLVNPPRVARRVRSIVEQVAGPDHLLWPGEPVLGGEDFAYFLQHVPGAMMRVGVKNTEVGSTYAWHHPRFTIDEDAMAVGIQVLSGAVLKALNSAN